MLFVYPDRAAFAAEALSWRVRRDNGVKWLELDQDELRQREPSLDRRYTFAVLVEQNGQCRDPGAYVAALARHAVALGATLVQFAATGFRIAAGRLQAVTTRDGEVACDKAVIAAGARSKVLAAASGDHVLLETERGYHVVISDPGIAPRYPLMPSDGKMACVMTPAGLRLAGQVELAGLEAAPNWQRAEVLLAFARRVFPELPENGRRSGLNCGWAPTLHARRPAGDRPRVTLPGCAIRVRPWPCRADRRGDHRQGRC